MEAREHTSGILVREDGAVFIPTSGVRKEHWTYGWVTSEGYRKVKYCGKAYPVHRLVAETFLDKPEGKCEIDHIDRNRENNNRDNLRYVTSSENQRNTSRYDRVSERDGIHKCDDRKAYYREYMRRWRSTRKMAGG